MIGLAELLKTRGLDLSKKIKIVRHQDKENDVQLMLEKGQLEAYQSYQTNAVFDCDYVVSTLGDESTKALFYNVYQVTGKRKAREVPASGEYIFEKFAHARSKEKTAGITIYISWTTFADLSNRVIIEWGKAALSWHQWFDDENR